MKRRWSATFWISKGVTPTNTEWIKMIAPRPMYGISRIDQEEKKNHGWYVRVTLKGVITQKFFADKTHGGKPRALKCAQEHRNSLVEQLPVARQAAAAKKRATRKVPVL